MKASQVQGTKAAPSRECGWRGRVGGGSQAVRAMETQVQLESGSWRSKRKIIGQTRQGTVEVKSSDSKC